MEPIPSLTGAGELLAYVPYQLGFNPSDSVVLVGFDEDDHLVVTARFDPVVPEAVNDIAHLIGQGRLRTLASAALVNYGDGDAVLLTSSVLRTALRCNGIELVHVWEVDNGTSTWAALWCCCGQCPEQRTPLTEAHLIPAAVEAVYRGCSPAPSRDDLENRCTPTQDEAQIAAEVEELWSVMEADLETGRDLELVAVHRILRGDPAALDDPVTVSRALAAVQVVGVRDGLLCWLRPDVFPPTRLSRSDRDRWQQSGELPSPNRAERAGTVHILIRWACRVPAQLSAPLWACVAASEWADGGSAVATIALDRAFEADPGCRLASLVRNCLLTGTLPGGRIDPAA
ncbi:MULTISPECIES: DUF4192 domain-containing protein [Yimella]|uniref:Uncharacterized protein DUF4192 n=1 Tax=Yimella lutea TaxID=587872 RepID=A0A542EFQ2_9MICO|nr:MULTISPECIES: DUF4192 domain-containing protein [Yimella]MCG8655641.1 DUF4192 domain-containing protein [Yimella sp. NH-Cas1]TQJ14167.1 uncharacterized protein DUF4192 [Yimella lutea]